MSEPRRISINDLMAATGVGPKTARRLVREGIFPGHMDGRTFICTPGEFDAWYEGRHARPVKQVTSITPIVRRKSA